MDYSNITEVLEQLKATTKRNDKITILEANKGDKNLKAFFEFVFNPFKITGISKKKFETLKTIDLSKFKFKPLSSFEDLYSYLINNNTGRHEDLAAISDLWSNASTTDKLLIEYIVVKNIQIGVDTPTLNKVYGNKFIPTYNVQLALRYQDNKDVVNGKHIFLSTKIDGNRCNIIKKGNEITCYNRSGIQIEGLDEITAEVATLNWEGVLDGELYAIGNFKESKEGYQSTSKIARTKGLKTGLKLRVYDCLTIKEFEDQKGTIPYIERRKLFEKLCENKKFIEALPVLKQGILSEEEITACCKEKTEAGEEGIMINIGSDVYAFTRGKSLLKYKFYQDIDLRCTGLREGNNKYVGMVGSLVVSYKGYEVEVGTGLSDGLRKAYWDNPNLVVGKIISVKYFEETLNQNGTKSLRFPVYLDVRDDKLEPDA